MSGFILWDQVSANVEVAKITKVMSSFLFVTYIVLSILTKKSRYIAAFLFCEFVSYSVLFDSLTNVQYYLIPAVVYCYLCMTLISEKQYKKRILSCAIIVLFHSYAAYNDYFYREIETDFYLLYEYIFFLIHLLFVFTIIDWEILRSNLGAIIDSFIDLYRVNYNVLYFCYYHKNNYQS